MYKGLYRGHITQRNYYLRSGIRDFISRMGNQLEKTADNEMETEFMKRFRRLRDSENGGGALDFGRRFGLYYTAFYIEALEGLIEV